MKKISAFFILILACISLKAQDAESLFKAAVEKIKGFDNIEIQFEYSMINSEAGINQTLNGSGFLKGEIRHNGTAHHLRRCNIMDIRL